MVINEQDSGWAHARFVSLQVEYMLIGSNHHQIDPDHPPTTSQTWRTVEETDRKRVFSFCTSETSIYRDLLRLTIWMSNSTRQAFYCRECNAEIVVNAPMREALITHGCVLCGASVEEDSFS